MPILLNDPQALQTQNMRTEIIALLRTSALAEDYKQSLMVMLPYLPLNRLQPVRQKLEQETELRGGVSGMTSRL